MNNTKTTITRKEYDKALKYARKTQLNSVIDYLTKYEENIVCKDTKLSSFLTVANLRHMNFLRAIYIMAQKGNSFGFTRTEEDYEKELAYFDKSKLIQDTVIETAILYEQLQQLLNERFNYEYIKEVLDKIAQDNGYILVSKQELYNMTFTVPESFQLIIGLNETNGTVTDYDVMELRLCKDYPYYYIKQTTNENGGKQ